MFVYPKRYQVVVVGGGHAGIEAAMAVARLGCHTLMLTQNLDTIGQMSCNPAVGGLAKGHMVREIDALGGVMGLNTDATGIQFRTLNANKGPSVRAPRAQCDKKAYQFRMKAMLEGAANLDLLQGNVLRIVEEGGEVRGIETTLGLRIHASAVIITTGTFMRGLLHVGLQNQAGGRMGDGVSTLSDSLRELGFEIGRFKTGTPCRLNSRSIDFSRCERQEGDDPPPRFSFRPEELEKGANDFFTLNEFRGELFHVEQIPCWITHTTARTHEIIRANLDKSPMYSGRIEGIGPRYCPSIEDKVVKFATKEQHQLFLEPEGRHTREYYVNGLSTSLPFEVQYEFIHSIPGLEHAEILRSGYAVEYDYCPPVQLRPTLETHKISGLFFAGQINGTSGYEEAAAQGLVAGINAGLKILGKPPFSLSRSEAYIGVLIDDLVTRGTQEPYRMFTSRAEYRLLLRQDNADIRLTPKAWEYGLVSESQWAAAKKKLEAILAAKQLATKVRIEQVRLDQLLRRPDFSVGLLPADLLHDFSSAVWEQVETDFKYEGYIQRQEVSIARAERAEAKSIPDRLDYENVRGLRIEARQKFSKIRPATLGQAGRISGITPADIALLTIHLEKG
ncbi:MAG: tRNA uridine-5-carboxymethylaminomethyl(34) synthesis enzyme MnmG [Verrucomicrobia bacterium]|nr:tRNA uridine-5-carboxymethylaminomethyl(34) synthesis enzyme MnmG [Verrucomicrobiota bacterium]